MTKKKRTSLQDIIRKRQQEEFVGRSEQLDLFRTNLNKSWDDDQRVFLFNVHGQGGVGKSTLLNRFRQIANEMGSVAALVDEQDPDVPAVLARLAMQLRRQGHELKQFDARYKTYRQKREELEADPEAPQGFTALAARALTKATAQVMRHTVPGSGMVLDMVDEDAISESLGEWADYVRRRLTNKDEVHLILQPEEVLTPLFLDEVGNITEDKTVVVFFDTFERTSAYLDSWLRDLLIGRFGDVPADIIMVIAGRDELDRNDWLAFEGVTAHISLEPFDEKEAREYLKRKAITNEQVIDTILQLSGRFPLLVATLAAESPDTLDKIDYASSTSVDRFLKWITDPQQRQITIDASIPRSLNKDIFSLLIESEQNGQLFNWFLRMPFVQSRGDGWIYHEIVRTQMLRHKRRESPQEWTELHKRLADYFADRRDALHLNASNGRHNPTWQAYELQHRYHQLCQNPQVFLASVLNSFLFNALKADFEFAERWAVTIQQAGQDSGDEDVIGWGNSLYAGLKAYFDENYGVAIKMFDRILDHPELDPHARAVAQGWRGQTHWLTGEYVKAIDDFDKSLDLKPQFPLALAYRADAKRRLGDFNGAMEDFNNAINIDPRYLWARVNRARTYRSIGEFDKALLDLDYVIDLAPANHWAIAHRGLTYGRMFQYEQALEDFLLATKLREGYDWVIAQIGFTYRLIGDHEKAIAYVSQAIELTPNWAWLYVSRGLSYLLTGREHLAFDDFDTAVKSRKLERNANYYRGFIYRGMVHRRFNRFEESLADLDTAVEQMADAYTAYYQRGLTHQCLRNTQRANRDFLEALHLIEQRAGGKFPDWWQRIEYARCLLAAGKFDIAIATYQEFLKTGIPACSVEEELFYLADFLQIFPKCDAASKVIKMLERYLTQLGEEYIGKTIRS